MGAYSRCRTLESSVDGTLTELPATLVERWLRAMPQNQVKGGSSGGYLSGSSGLSTTVQNRVRGQRTESLQTQSGKCWQLEIGQHVKVGFLTT